MRYDRDNGSAEISALDPSDLGVTHPGAAIRSYRAIAAILTERYGRPFTFESVGKRCTAAERRLAAGLRSDPIIQRWLRRQGLELGAA